jgi:single-strand DNA-binding protein
MNKVILKGRMTADAEMKSTSNGVEYCNFSIAVDRYQGKDKERTADFIPCKAWRQTAAFVDKYFGKGKEILIDGEIHFDKYEKDGENRTFAYVSVNGVEFCGSKLEGNNSSGVSSPDPLETVKNRLDSITDDDTPAPADGDLPF